MIEIKKLMTLVPSSWWYASIILIGGFLLSGVVAGQDQPTGVPPHMPQPPAAFGVHLQGQFTPTYEGKTGNPQQADYPKLRIVDMGIDETGQQKAAPADNNPLVRLGQLQVEVARQTRLGTKSSFFPQIGSTFTNIHFNKFMGQELQLANRSVGVPLTGKDQTLVAVTATQPITPLFQLRELYKINLADERIARAKAGMPVSETANKVEKAYYELLVAQRQLAFANVKSKETENKWLLASNSTVLVASAGDDAELIETSNALAIATTRVKELTASLDDSSDGRLIQSCSWCLPTHVLNKFH